MPDTAAPQDPTAPVVHRFGPPSRRSRALATAVGLTWRPLMGHWPIRPRAVALAQRLTDPGPRGMLVRGTRVDRLAVAGRPAEWIRAPRALRDAPDDAHGVPPRAILYLHGGGYLFGSPATHRGMISALSHVTATPALAIDYRLPPAAMMPAPIEDAVAAYRHLLDRGIPPRRILVAGDSAGGGLTLTCVLEALHQHLPAPGGLILLSPWTDLAVTGDSARESRKDRLIPRGALHHAARVVVGPHDPRDWRLSPLYAPEELVARLPPSIVQVGSGELLLDDARRMAERIAAAGVACELQVWEGQTHVVPMWTGTPEAKRALRELGRFSREILGEDAPGAPSDASLAEAAAAGRVDALPPA